MGCPVYTLEATWSHGGWVGRGRGPAVDQPQEALSSVSVMAPQELQVWYALLHGHETALGVLLKAPE